MLVFKHVSNFITIDSIWCDAIERIDTVERRRSVYGRVKERRRENELTKHDLQLGFGEPLCDASMGTVAETQGIHRIELAIQIELVRIGEDLCVTVAGLAGGDDALAGFDCLEAMSGTVPVAKQNRVVERGR